MNKLLPQCKGLGSLFFWTACPKEFSLRGALLCPNPLSSHSPDSCLLPSLADVFLQTEGIYGIECMHYHGEDIDWEHAEGIPHYVVLNAGTNAVFLYPEFVVRTEDDLVDIDGFFESLMEPPYLLKFKWWLPATKYARRLAIKLNPGHEDLPLAPSLREHLPAPAAPLPSPSSSSTETHTAMQWPQDVLALVRDKVRELIRPGLKARLWAEVHCELVFKIAGYDVAGLFELMKGFELQKRLLARRWVIAQGFSNVASIASKAKDTAFLRAIGIDDSSISAQVIRERLLELAGVLYVNMPPSPPSSPPEGSQPRPWESLASKVNRIRNHLQLPAGTIASVIQAANAIAGLQPVSVSYVVQADALLEALNLH